jgi:hypothetical protein
MLPLDRSSEIELSVIGRSSGANIEKPVWFVYKSNKLYLLPLNGSETNWYKNILKNPAIKVSVDNTKITPSARPITDSSRVRQIVDAFRFKYTKFDTIVEIPLS